MMSFFTLLASFAPWIAFLIIARDTLLRVEIGLVVALVFTIAMALMKLHRGIVMRVGLVFFTGATIAVIGFHNVWTIHHLGVLANGALALGSWATLVLGRPFTLEYARQHTDPAKWNDPLFIRVNVLLTSVWAVTFTFNTALAWVLMKRLWPEWACHTASYAALVGAAAFTSWYPGRVRRVRGQLTGEPD